MHNTKRKRKKENAAGKLKGIIKESTAGQSYIDTRNGDSLHWSPISKESYSGSITEKKIYIYIIYTKSGDGGGDGSSFSSRYAA